MKHKKLIFVFGFALFAGFFGAGNLILPPLLGFKAGNDWLMVALGFAITTTVIPLLSLLVHAKLQGTMLDFANKVSPKFSLVYCVILYFIIVALPAPRTAAVTHEIAIAPIFNSPQILTSVLYFILVLIFVLNRTQVLSILGKYLTPIIVCMVFLIIGLGFFTMPDTQNSSVLIRPFTDGFLEGYQTYDTLAGMVMGGVMILTLKTQGFNSYEEKRRIIARSGIVAMIGLFIVYAGLIALGANYNTMFSTTISRTELLLGLSIATLGSLGANFVSVLVSLACFTTAVAIIVSICDFFSEIIIGSAHTYTITAVVCCVVGVIMGSYNVGFIIDIALPALMLIYPVSIVLIILNLIYDKWASPIVFKGVVIVTLIFSLTDVLPFFMASEDLEPILKSIPLARYNMGWIFPSLATFFSLNLNQVLGGNISNSM